MLLCVHTDNVTGSVDPFKAFVECPPRRPARQYHTWHLCDLARLPASCVVYSVGPPHDDYAFEREIISQTKCEVHTFDCTSAGSSIDARHKFHKICLGSSSALHQTLTETVIGLGHVSGIEVIKIGQAEGGLKQGSLLDCCAPQLV